MASKPQEIAVPAQVVLSGFMENIIVLDRMGLRPQLGRANTQRVFTAQPGKFKEPPENESGGGPSERAG